MGLDLSPTATGIIVLDDDLGDTVKEQIVHYELAGHRLPKDAPEMVKLGRMISIAKACCRVAREHKVQAIRIEGPALGAKFGLFLLGGLTYVVRCQLRLARSLDCDTVPSTAMRKEALGRGSRPKSFIGTGKNRKRWTKQWVAKMLRDLYDVDFKEDNLNDALVAAICSQKRERRAAEG